MLRSLITELRKLYRGDVAIYCAIYFILTSIMYLLGFFENGYNLSVSLTVYYFLKIFSIYSLFIFSAFVIIIVGKELSIGFFANTIINGKSVLLYLRDKILLILFISLVVLLIELVRLTIISILFDLRIRDILFIIGISNLLKALFLLFYVGIGGILIISLFRKVSLALFVLYFYVQFEIFFNHEYFTNRIGIDLFKVFPAYITRTRFNC